MRLMMLCWLAILALAGSPVHAALPARPDGPILDSAQIIPDDQEAALAQRLSDYNKKTGRALMVVSVTSLDGEDVATYANNLFHTWGIGGKTTDQGALLLVAPSERKLRIEVGYGLEEFLPDAIANRIIADTIRPKFKAGDYVGGISAGIDAITAQLDKDPAEAKAIAEAAKAIEAQRASRSDGGSNVGSAIFWLFLILFLVLSFSRRGYRRGRRYRGDSGIDPGIVLWGLSEVMHHASKSGSWGGGNDWGGGGGGGSDWGGFGGGDSGGGGASGDW